MKQVAKLIIVDPNNQYLLMYRNNHPRFGNDPDLPGGTLEEGEEPIDAMIREVEEEAGVVLDKSRVNKLYQGAGYSAHGTEYSLYITRFVYRPELTISWEHSDYVWTSLDEFKKICAGANDTYMQMVAKEYEKFISK